MRQVSKLGEVVRMAAMRLTMAAAVGVAISVSPVAAGDQRLIDAVRAQNATAVRDLLMKKVDVNARQPDGASALHWAAQWDDVDIATRLLRAGARADVANDYGTTPLMIAAQNGSAAMTRALLTHGASARAAMPSGETVLMTAARAGNADVVKALVTAGADVNARERAHDQTALMWAVAEQHLDVVRLLVESGADAKARSSGGFTPLLFAARMGNIDLVRFFLDKGEGIDETAQDGTTPLAAAMVRGHVRLVEWLLERGADPNKDSIGFAPLHWAVGTFDTMSTKEYTTEDGEWSALAGIPRRDQKLALVKMLITRGANVNARVKGRMPRFGYTLGGGSIVGGGSYAGATPFFLASAVGDVEMMKLLLARGADPSVATQDGTTPLIAAAGISIVEAEASTTEAQMLEALKLAMSLGNDIKAANEAGSTALHATAYVGYNVIAQFLVDNGAVLNAKDKKGQTPFKIASGIPMSGMFYSQPKTAELLKKLGGTD